MKKGEHGRRRTLERAPALRRGPVLVVLAAIALIPAAYWLLRPRPKPPVLAEAGQVQSAVTQEGDSLQVVVRWRALRSIGRRPVDSLRVEVRVDSMGAPASRVRLHPASGVRIRCTCPRHCRARRPTDCRASRRSITRWSRARPVRHGGTCVRTPVYRRRRPAGARARRTDRRGPAGADRHSAERIAGGPRYRRAVRGMAAAASDGAGWIEVNRVAVPPCTGPNNRPTVAQFCAFAELAEAGGSKPRTRPTIRTATSSFGQWERVRYPDATPLITAVTDSRRPPSPFGQFLD